MKSEKRRKTTVGPVIKCLYIITPRRTHTHSIRIYCHLPHLRCYPYMKPSITHWVIFPVTRIHGGSRRRRIHAAVCVCIEWCVCAPARPNFEYVLNSITRIIFT